MTDFLGALYRTMTSAALEELARALRLDRRAGAEPAFVDVRLEAIAAELRRRVEAGEDPRRDT